MEARPRKSTPDGGQINESARLLGRIMQLSPEDFEEMVAGLFELEGFTAQTTKRSGDGGVDLYLQRGDSFSIAQCKRYRGTVGEEVVRDLYGTMLHQQAQGAFLVTTGRISEPARSFAAGKPLRLFDGQYLLRWISKHEGDIADDTPTPAKSGQRASTPHPPQPQLPRPLTPGQPLRTLTPGQQAILTPPPAEPRYINPRYQPPDNTPTYTRVGSGAALFGAIAIAVVVVVVVGLLLALLGGR